MFKVFLLLSLLYVILLIFFALKAVGETPAADCDDTYVIDRSTAITGYMEADLRDRIVEVLSGLLKDVHPVRVFVGRMGKGVLDRGHVAKGLGKVYLLYGTTSVDFGEQVIRAVSDFLRSRGYDRVEIRNLLDSGDKYYYIFVGLC